MEFCFKKDMLELFKNPNLILMYDINYLRGISCPRLKKSLVNLSALQWQVLSEINEDKLIEELVKTIVHEIVHDLINTCYYEDMYYTTEGEEQVAAILADQDKENKTFVG